MISIFLSCGSNLGDRAKNLAVAEERLCSDGKLSVVGRSSLYETSPVEFREQPFFLNNVIEVETSLEPVDLLGKIKAMEKELNINDRIPKGPRYIDIDILLFNDLKTEDEFLTIPHPGICRRKFVLVPLLELSPGQFCSRDNRSFRECLRALDDPTQEVRHYRG